jgi:arsenate reductase (glutaredoxin)
LLGEHAVEYRYREYTEEPLSKAEIERVLRMLGVGPHDVLRKNDRAYKELGLTGKESAKTLVKLMAEHPTLLQRPIAIAGKRAVLGRPVENLLALIDGA